MYARARYKLDIDDKVIQAGRFDNKSTQEEQEEFLVRQPDLFELVLSNSVTCSGLFQKQTKTKRTKKQGT